MHKDEGNMRELMHYNFKVFFLRLEGTAFQSLKLFGVFF
jgi:hypothetical protein